MIVEPIPEFVELGVGQEEAVEGQRDEDFADDLDAEAGDGQQPRADVVR